METPNQSLLLHIISSWSCSLQMQSICILRFPSKSAVSSLNQMIKRKGQGRESHLRWQRNRSTILSILPFPGNRLHSETVPGPDRCLLSRTQNAPPRPAPPLQCFTRLVARSAIETTIVFFLQMHFASEFHLNLHSCPSHAFRFLHNQIFIPTAANLTQSPAQSARCREI